MSRRRIIPGICGLPVFLLLSVASAAADDAVCTRPVVCDDGSCVYFEAQCPDPSPPPDDPPDTDPPSPPAPPPPPPPPPPSGPPPDPDAPPSTRSGRIQDYETKSAAAKESLDEVNTRSVTAGEKLLADLGASRDAADFLGDRAATAGEAGETAGELQLTIADVVSRRLQTAARAGNLARSPTAGDPVRLVSGAFVHGDADLELRFGELSFTVRRQYSSRAAFSGSDGGGWFRAAESHVLRGVDPGAVAAADEAARLLRRIEQKRDEARERYRRHFGRPGEYRSLLRDIRRRRRDLEAARDESGHAVADAEDAVEAGRVLCDRHPLACRWNDERPELARALLSRAEGRRERVLETLAAVRRGEQDLRRAHGHLMGIRREESRTRARLLELESRAALSAANARRNAVLSRFERPAWAEMLGTQRLLVVGEDRVPRLYRITADPAPGGRSGPAGAFYPGGSALLAEDPSNRREGRLRADGSVELRLPDGETRFYDGAGRLVGKEDRAGRRIRISYRSPAHAPEADHRIARVLTGDGRALSYRYDGEGRLAAVSGPGGVRVSYAHRPGGGLAAVTDPVGATRRYHYEEDRLSRIEQPDGSSRHYSYRQGPEGDWRVVATEDEAGYREHFRYHPGDSPYGAGYTEHEDYHAADGRGMRTRYHYDEHYRVVRVESLSAKGAVVSWTARDYDQAGRLRERRLGGDGTVRTWRFRYDSRGRRSARIDPDGREERWSYNRHNRVLSYRNGAGEVTRHRYDSRGLRTATDRPDGSALRYRYDESGRLISELRRLNGDWVQTRYAYNAAGQVTRVEYPEGGTEHFQYDAFGRLLTQVTRLGFRTRYERRADGRVTAREYGDGTREELSYDERGNLLSRRDRLGRTTQYRYDQRGLLTEERDGARRVRYRYGPDGRLAARRVEPLSGSAAASPAPEPAPAADPAGVWRYRYNDTGRLVAVVEETTGVARHYRYDAAGNVTEERISSTAGGASGAVPVSRRTRYGYSPAGLPLWQENGEGERLHFTYDSAGRLTSRRDPLGFTLRYRYRPERRELAISHAAGEAPERRRYDEAGRLVAREDAGGDTWNYRYDAAGRIVLEEAPNGARTRYRYRYTGSGVELRRTDPAGEEWLREFGAEGRLRAATDPSGATWRYEHDPAGRLRAVTDPLGERETYRYDSRDRLLAVTDPGGNTHRAGYDALDRPAFRTLPTGETVRFRHDALGRLLWWEDPVGGRSSFRYNAAGDLLSRREPSGRQWRYSHDRAGRLVEEIDPAGALRRYRYDERGRLIAEVDPEGRPRTRRYQENARGLLIGETDRLGNTRRYRRDTSGRVREVREPDGSRRSFRYHPGGALAEERVDGRLVRRFRYTARGQLAAAESPDAVLSFSYNARGLLTESRDLTAGAGLAYSYNALGRRSSLRTLSGEGGAVPAVGGSVSYRYGAAGELLALSVDPPADSAASAGPSDRREIRFSYDGSLREVARRYPTGLTAQRSYDAAGRLAGVVHRQSPDSPPGQSPLQVAAAGTGRVLQAELYLYDADGRRSHLIDEEGAVTRYSYGPVGRLREVSYPYAEALLESQVRELAELGIRSGASELPSAHSPTVLQLSREERRRIRTVREKLLPRRGPRIPRLRGSWIESFRYDSRGNRTERRTALGRVRYRYDAENRQTRAGALRLEYGAAGRLVETRRPGLEVTRSYGARRRSSVVHTRRSPRAGGSSSHRIRYGYDAFGRRVFRQEEGATHRYLYDGFSVERVLSLADVPAGPGEAGAAPTRYPGVEPKPPSPGDARTYRPAPSQTLPAAPGPAGRGGGDRAILTVRAGSAVLAQLSSRRSRYHGTDALGSITLTVETARMPSGSYSPPAEVEEISYRAFGSLVTGAPRPGESFAYTGKPLEESRGVYDYGFREYAAMTGSFTTEDPIRSGHNWYAYARQDPVNFVDPLGLEALPPGTGVVVDPSVDPFRGDGTVDQLAFDARYGFGNRSGTQSCQTAAVCSLYSRQTPGGMSTEQLDTIVEDSLRDGGIHPDLGSVTDFGTLSRAAARTLGRSTYYEYIYEAPHYQKTSVTPAEFEASEWDVGLVRLNHVTEGTNHFVANAAGNVYDPLESTRPLAAGYVAQQVRPLRLLPLPGSASRRRRNRE